MMVRQIASHTSMKVNDPMHRADAFDRCALGAQRREVVTDSAALLHGERRFAQMLGRCRLISSGTVPMTKQLKSVTFRLAPAPAMNPAAGHELEIRHGRREALGISARICGASDWRALRDPVPGVLDRLIDRGAVGAFERLFMSQICWEWRPLADSKTLFGGGAGGGPQFTQQLGTLTRVKVR